MISFILLNCELGKEEEVSQQLGKIEKIKEIHRMYGAYDIVVKVKTDSDSELNSIILDKVRKIPHIRSTLTLKTTAMA